MHKPLQLKALSLSFPHKTCFSNFSAEILHGSRIAIIGRNGEGKSTLISLLQGQDIAFDGELVLPEDLRIGYVPQVIDTFGTLSGGERLNKVLTRTLSHDPNLLLLDEPTNHLDAANRQSLMRLLAQYTGTIVMVSHDVELLRNTVDTLWHIDQGQIHVFCGSYDDYQRERGMKYHSIEQELSAMKRQKKESHLALMKEQKRAKNSRARGEKHIQQRKWPTVRSATKVLNAVETSGRKRSVMQHQKQALIDKLSVLKQPEVITHKFSLNAKVSHRQLVSICQGSIGYCENTMLLKDVNLSIQAHDRISISGDNGSGKSTLIKAILDDPAVIKQGEWALPNRAVIGYLDQHYATLLPEKTVIEHMFDALPHATYVEIRKHLNDFLFRKNEEVEACISSLSGGEKARLSLALIAAQIPKLLILDEMTNNLDLETRTHVIEVLRAYPAAIIVISHDLDFLASINITTQYQMDHGFIELVV